MLHNFVIANHGHADENQDDAHDDHQLNEREPEIASSAATRPQFPSKSIVPLNLHFKFNLLSPIRVLRAIHGRSSGLGIHIKNVLAAPMPRIWIVLDRSQAPVGAAGHGINGDLPQKNNLLVAAASKLHATHESLEIRWITFGSDIDTDGLVVRSVFVTVDGVADFVEIVAKNRLFLANHSVPGDRQSRGR